jgi:hypothetical protein
MKLRHLGISIAAMAALGAANASRAAVLFSDTFNRANGPLDSTPIAPGEVGGTLASAITVESEQTEQYIVGGQLQLQTEFPYSSIRFNNQYDWSTSAAAPSILSAGGMSISFDWTPPDTSSEWIDLSAGDSNPNNAYNFLSAADVATLVRNNGGTATFSDSGATAVTTPGWAGASNLPQSYHVEFDLLFNSFAIGSPVTMNTYVGGQLAATETASWSYGYNYISIGTASGGPLLDNLVVATVPEPASLSVLMIGSLGLLARRRRRSV